MQPSDLKQCHVSELPAAEMTEEPMVRDYSKVTSSLRDIHVDDGPTRNAGHSITVFHRMSSGRHLSDVLSHSHGLPSSNIRSMQ